MCASTPHVEPMAEAGTDQAKLATTSYGLLKPFLDGMFDAATGNAVIVDGFEVVGQNQSILGGVESCPSSR